MSEQAPQAQKPAKEEQVKLITRDFVLIAVANFCMFTSFQMTNNGLPVYLAKLNATDFEIGLVLTLMTLTALIIRPFAGLILDSFGRKGTLFAGLAIMLVTTICYAVFPLVAIILCLRIFHGIGWGMGSTGCSTMVADILPKPRFAEGMGWYALGTSLSGAIGPALSLVLIERVSSEAMIFVAAACLGAAFLVSLLVEESVKVDEQARKEKKKLTFDSFFERKALMPAAGMALCNTGFSAVTAFVAIYALAQGIEDVALYFVAYAITNLVTRPMIGRLVDKNGFLIPGILGLIGVTFTMVFISFSTNLPMLCLAGVFGGLGLGAVMTVLQTMAVSTVSPMRKGVATSTFLSGLDGGLCIGSILAGTAATMLGYSGMFLVMSIFPALALVMFVITFKKWEASAKAESPRM